MTQDGKNPLAYLYGGSRRGASCEIPELIQEQPASEIPIPEERRQAMITYAQKLRKKFPHMKKDRLMRKVAEYFKVKLV